jgi:YD repeat-containing protein
MQNRPRRRREPSFDDFQRRLPGDEGDFLVVPQGNRPYFAGSPVPAVGMTFVERGGLFLPESAVRPPQPIDLMGTYLTFGEIFGRRPGLAYVETAYTYDLGGRVIETDDGFACATGSFDYRDLPTVTTSGLAGGTCVDAADTRELTHTHDGLGRLTRSEVTDGADLGDRTVDDVFDAVGNRRSAAVRIDSVTSTTTFAVNLIDQLTSESRPDGSTAKATFDPPGNPTDRCYWKPGITVGACYPVGTTPWTNPPTQVTTTAYDARNELVSLTDAAADSTTTYDPDENYAIDGGFRSTASGREHQSLYAYDSRHRLTGITFQTCTADASHVCTDAEVSNGSDTYGYDDNDNRTQVVEHNGSGSSDRRYCYDARNQLVFRNAGAACSSGSNDEAWTYDDAGNRLTATTGGTTTNFAYDSAGLLCDVEVGSAASCTGGNVGHDTAGRIESWSGWTFAYDADGRLVTACKSTTCASGFDKVEFTYDGEGHRTQIVATAAGGSVTTTLFRYQGDAVVEEKVNGTVVREFVSDGSGTISKLAIPAGQTDAGTYLITWNGHGDALNLLRVNGDGTTTLANLNRPGFRGDSGDWISSGLTGHL